MSHQNPAPPSNDDSDFGRAPSPSEEVFGELHSCAAALSHTNHERQAHLGTNEEPVPEEAADA